MVFGWRVSRLLPPLLSAAYAFAERLYGANVLVDTRLFDAKE